MNKIKTFLKRHKNNFFIKPLFKIKEALEKTQSVKRLKKLSKIVIKDRKIRVVFVVIDSNTWNKIKALYFEMKQSDKLEVFLVCCPEPYKDSAKTYNYFVNEGYDCIDARIGNGPWNAIEKQGDWFDLKSLNPDYVFYTEPYNLYLPPKYKSNIVSRYAKICVVCYGTTTTQEFLEIRPRNFYKDVYLCYANNLDEKNYNINQFKKNHEKGLQKTKYLGWLAYADFVAQKDLLSEQWKFSLNKTKVLWTPRWTSDKTSGGTNFFRYKDVLINYAKQNADVDFLFRPHPMALDNFVRTGEMTKQQVDEFVNICDTSKNLSLDTSANYVPAFWNSSFLVTDISSIIVEYFVTGKPIIYCTALDANMQFLPYFKRIIDCCYKVNNQDELIKTINYLKSGQDQKFVARMQLIDELYPDSINAPKNILNDIINDATKNKLK